MGKKITQLATITEVADDDLIVGVDVSDTSGSENGTNKKFTKASLLDGLAPLGPQITGWNPLGEDLVYVSVDDPTGVVKVEGKDITDKLSVGMRLRFTNGGNVIYAIITAITFSVDTTITFLHEIDPADSQALHLLTNSAITLPYFSSQKVPYGFPINPLKWSVQKEISSEVVLNGISYNTVYNLTGVNITKPIGLFNATVDLYGIGVELQSNTTNTPLYEIQLSESSSSMTGEFPRRLQQINIGSLTVQTIQRYDSIYFEKKVVKETKQTYYLNIIVTRSHPAGGNINVRMSTYSHVSRIMFTCAYL